MTWKICLLKDIVLFSLHFYVLVSISFSLKDVTGNADEECRELAFPDFFFFANKRLVKHNIRTVDVRNLDACEMLCYREPNCVSINFEREATAEGKFRCDLNNATHRGHDDEFVDTEGYFYRGAQSACDIVQCKNSGTCQSGFTEKGYRCLCSSGFNGENCETDIDECTAGTYNCSEDATCSNTKGDYNCSCNAGYTGDGHICTAFDICVAQNPCQNGAECINNGDGTHACKCEVGYSGNNCEHKFLTTSQILLTQASLSDHLQQYLAPVGLSWTLCYSTTVYPQYASDFHKHCDGKPNTVTIIKKAGYIFGGFTDIPWDSSGTYGHTSNAFIFSLRNNEGLAPFQANVTVPPQAIFKASYYGPTFGGGHDIRVLKDKNKLSETQFGHSYSIPTGVQNQSTILAGNVTFIPDEVEVFYLAPS